MGNFGNVSGAVVCYSIFIPCKLVASGCVDCGRGAFVAVVQNIYESIDYFGEYVFPFTNPPPVARYFHGLIPVGEFDDFDGDIYPQKVTFWHFSLLHLKNQ